MPSFQLEAKHDITRGTMHIDKGATFMITINMAGIGPNNLFNNQRCFEQLKKQFEINDIFLSDTDMKNAGNWNIKKV